MALFSSDVYNSTKEKPASTQYDPYADYLKKRSKAATDWEGSPNAIAPQTSLADDIAAEQTYRSGEYTRREQAAGQQMNLAKAEDTRQGTIADRVREALRGRQNAVDEIGTKQAQAEKTQAQSIREMQQEFTQKNAQQDFSAYKSAADRYDTLMSAYDKGNAEIAMIEAAKANSLKMQDIEAYFARMKQDMANVLKDYEQDARLNADRLEREIQSSGQGIADVLGGLFKIGGLVTSKVISGGF